MTTAWSCHVNSPDLPEPIEIEADNVVLSTGVEADLKATNACPICSKCRSMPTVSMSKRT